MDFDWKGIVKSVAPAIATGLGGPFAGLAAKAITGALLGDQAPVQPSDDQVAAAVAGATPEDLLKLKQADNDFKLQMEKIGVDLEQIAANDRDSARKREMAVKDSTPTVLAYAYTAGYFAILACIMRFGVPAEVKELVNTLIGILSGAELGIITYYFGSSAGSARKTELLGGK